jgi:hypothetical protein
MSVLQCIEKNFDHVIKKWQERGQGYELKLGKLGTHLIIDGDAALPKEKSCDCVVVVQTKSQVVVAVVELKKKLKSVTDILEKMRNTVKLVTKMLDTCNQGLPVEFFPVLYHAGIKATTMSELGRDKSKIRFRGKEHSIIPRKHGVPLSKVIETFRTVE